MDKTLRNITTSLGIRTATVHPRAHDLRHSFAVATLIGWLRSGVSVDERMAVLSTYLGHVAPADTYWYLSASPELMAVAEHWARQILECSPLLVSLTKESARAGSGLPIDEAIDGDWQERIPRMLASQDYIEGPKAFFEKRKPAWTGR